MIKKFRICYKSSDGHKNIFYFGDSSQLMIGLDGTVYENYGRSNKPMWESVFDAEVVLQQWTGLLDKNGREIYEGDILLWTEEARRYEVFFNEKFAHFSVRLLDKDAVHGYEFDWDFWESDEKIVVGNIFENPLDKLQNNN